MKKYIIKSNKEMEVKSNAKNSWLLAYADNSGFYIPNVLHVERNDDKMLVEDDKQACVEAEKSGIPLICDMQFVPNNVYVDTEENRRIILEMLKKYPEYKKIGLLDEIFDYYECEYEINSDGKIKEFKEDNNFTIYDSIDEVLKAWISTMEETNKNLFETGDVESQFNTWSKEQIEFIKSLT